MWNTLFIAAASLGAVLAWQAIKHRDGSGEGLRADGSTEPPRSDAMGEEFAKRWKAYLTGGLALFVIGAAGVSVQTWREISTTGPSSRDEFIDVLASDPDNTYDREEASCLYDAFLATGVDLTGYSSVDDVLDALASTVPTLQDSQLDRIDACLDEETRNRSAARVETLTDEQLREFFITALLADPAANTDRAEAECLLDQLEERGLIRELFNQGAELSPEMDAALFEVELACS